MRCWSWGALCTESGSKWGGREDPDLAKWVREQMILLHIRYSSATYATMCILMIRMRREEVLRSLTLSTTIPPLIGHPMHAISPHSYRELLFRALKMSCDYGSWAYA